MPRMDISKNTNVADPVRHSRRRYVPIAIALTCLPFFIFLCAVAREIKIDAQEFGVLPSLVLLAVAMGIAHGLHARLRHETPNNNAFESDPQKLDVVLVSLSIAFLVAGGVTSAVRALG